MHHLCFLGHACIKARTCEYQRRIKLGIYSCMWQSFVLLGAFKASKALRHHQCWQEKKHTRIYIYIYLYLFTCIYNCKYIYIYIITYIYIYPYLHIYIYIYIYIYSYLHIYIYIYLHIYRYIYIYSYLQIYINIYIYIYLSRFP